MDRDSRQQYAFGHTEWTFIDQIPVLAADPYAESP
jgi:hypothetical protein